MQPIVVTTRTLERAVSAYFGVSVSDIKGQSRKKHVMKARRMLITLMRDLTDSSYPDIGRAVGGRHHTTIITAYRKSVNLLRDDQYWKIEYDAMMRYLRNHDENVARAEMH